MSDSITIAIISSLSALFGGGLSALVQYLQNKFQEDRRRYDENEERIRSNRREAKERFESLIVGLLEASDPDINRNINLPTITKNIVRLQLIINRSDPTESQLNHHLNSLGIAAQKYMSTNDSADLLSHHGKLIDLAGLILRTRLADSAGL